MKVSALSKSSLIQSLATGTFKFKVSCFHVCLSSPIVAVAEHLMRLYGAFELVGDDEFIDFYIAIKAPNILRRFLRPQAVFSFDGYVPFKPLPYSHASAFFEWGLNWCIASQSQQYLIIHAAVVEKNGRAFIFPGTPGSGKSTLCAALTCRGWRLLSDEMTLISLADGLAYPVPRPISLKNQSLDIIGHFAPEVVIASIVHDTSKGTVGHLRPPDFSVASAAIPALPAKVIFPTYRQQAATELVALPKARAFMKTAENCFNYNILGSQGFNCLGRLCDGVDFYDFTYSNLDEAISLFAELAE